MPVQIQIDLAELPLIRAIDKIERGLADTTVLMEAIGTELADGARRRLETGVSPGGVPWPKSLRVKERGGQTLIDGGYLYASIQHLAERDEVRVGTNMPYGRIHQTGGVIRPKKGKALVFKLPNGQTVSVAKVTIPKRPYLGVDQEDRAGIEEHVRFFLEDLVR